MFELEFEEIGENKYKTEIPVEMYEYVIKIVDDISLGDMVDYIDDINKRLIDTVLSRLVASIAFKQNVDFNKTSFILIYCYYDVEPVIVSIGKLPINDNGEYGKVSGVYYI